MAQPEEWEERAVGDWLCCFGEGLPKKYYLGRQFFSPTLRGGWWDWQTNLQSIKWRPWRKHILLLISFVFLEGDGQIWLALSFRIRQPLSTLYNSVCLVSHGISCLKGAVGSCRQAHKDRCRKQKQTKALCHMQKKIYQGTFRRLDWREILVKDPRV